MTARRILTAALLLFVAAGIATFAAKEIRDRRPRDGHPPAMARPAAGRQIVAYYFVGNARCSSCRKIEEVSRKTIEGSFAREIADGRLRYVVVNVDMPDNRRFIEEFRLESSALVLAEIRDGKPAAWKNLPDVWTLVDDPSKLAAYVRGEVAAELKKI